MELNGTRLPLLHLLSSVPKALSCKLSPHDWVRSHDRCHLDDFTFLCDEPLLGVADLVAPNWSERNPNINAFISESRLDVGIGVRNNALKGWLPSPLLNLCFDHLLAARNMRLHLLSVVLEDASKHSLTPLAKIQGYMTYFLVVVTVFIFKKHSLFASEDLRFADDALSLLEQPLYSALLVDNRAIGKKCHGLASAELQ